MGDLIMMPARNSEMEAEQMEFHPGDRPEPICLIDAIKVEKNQVDLSVWKTAPRERTVAYFPTYSAVSRAIQTAMRTWVREWFAANPRLLLRPTSAYPILVYVCTHPFSGRPTNMFTYDIQQTEALDRAFASAAFRLGREMKDLDTRDLSWFKREHYFAYRSKEVLRYVIKNRRHLYKMLNVETMLMNSILKFAVMDLPSMDSVAAEKKLRRAFEVQLRRFSREVDMSGRVEELLFIATQALTAKVAQDNVVALPLAA